MVQTASPVLAVYIYAHALDELGAHPFESLHIPASQGEAPRTLDSIGVASLFDLYIKDKYTECPPVFQEVLSARMEGALARSVVANFYSALINSLSEAWAAIEDLPNRIDSESPYDSVLMCEKVAGDIATILQEMRPRERELVRSWPHTVSLDATIGADRFSEWCRLFEDMSQWEFDGDGAQELREVAKDFAEYFRGRLGKLDIRFSRSTSRYT
ncbi:hypothetical protein PsYK624_137100 [Phanerochaete sordida]|uniref:Uncharacterized protein n=1 Tax=Phanerochaete sordida TaxID=48140 RepID=A0A9P3GQ93_9APHY|nr:hypothetical protein PsYK624_137100 [Phanerochaete sordida]